MIEIQTTPSQVMAVLCDVERWSEWTPTVTRVQRLDRGPFQVGSRTQVQQPKLMPAVWEVTELDPLRNFTWVSHSPGVTTTAGHDVVPDGKMSRVTLSIEFTGLLGPLLSILYGNLSRKYMMMEAQGLKKRCERMSSHLEKEA